MPQNKPLVTIAMMTYNQERYVRNSVRGLLSQTYEPLEIVISDDCSTDRTWDIICEEVDSYKSHGGIHKNIVLNRNEENLGIAKHSELVGTFKHGEITVACGGDDISFPNRVERIVEVFKEADEDVLVVMHGVVCIDAQGRKIGESGSRAEKEPMGAAMAWRKANRALAFPTVSEVGAYEDRIGLCRVRISGGEISRIDDRLVYYRLGSGVSSSLSKHRLTDIKSESGIIAAYKQSLKDLECVKADISPERYESLRCEFVNEKHQRETLLQLYGADDLPSRYRAFVELGGSGFGIKARMLHSVYLLPHWLCDFLLDGYLRLKYAFRRFRAKKVIR